MPVIDIDEDLRREVGRSRPAHREGLFVDQRPRTLPHRFRGLRAHEVGRRRAHERPERGVRFQRIAEHVAARQRHGPFDETVVDRSVDIDALDAAAGLPGVEERAVDEVLDRVREIGIRAHVRRVLAAEFETDADEAAGRGALDRCTTSNRAGEGDVADVLVRDETCCRLVAHVQELQQAVRQAGLARRGGEPLGAERRLLRVLQEHRVARHQRRHDGVDRRQVGIVPRRDDEHDADRIAANEAREPGLGADVDIGERLRCQRDHPARTLLEAAHFARRVADRAAHLPGEFLRDRVTIGNERVDERGHQARALGERASAPVALRRDDTREGGSDLRIGGLSPFDIDRAVNGTDRLEGGHVR